MTPGQQASMCISYRGAVIDGWIAPALTDANPAPVPWTQEELFTYLRAGSGPLHGATGATMTPVIRGALDLPVVADSDIRAIAVSFSDMAHASTLAAVIQASTREALATSFLGSGQDYDPEADLYMLGLHLLPLQCLAGSDTRSSGIGV